MFYSGWMMAICSPFISYGWIGFYIQLKGKWKWMRLTGLTIGLLGIGFQFLSGVIGIIDGYLNQYIWFIGFFGTLSVLIGLLIFGVGSIIKTIIPLSMGILIPIISVLRMPGSPLLTMGDIIGYVLLEGIGLVIGLGWILIGVKRRNM